MAAVMAFARPGDHGHAGGGGSDICSHGGSHHDHVRGDGDLR